MKMTEYILKAALNSKTKLKKSQQKIKETVWVKRKQEKSDVEQTRHRKSTI